MEIVLKFLHSIYPLSPELAAYLKGTLQVKEVKKKEYLLRAGHICRSIYFIEYGLLRCFYLKGDTEVSSWFMREGDVIVSVESFFDQQKSYESIQALEDTKVYYISFADLEFAYRNFPEFNFVGRVLLQKYYQLSEQRLHSMRMQNAVQRYAFLLHHFPEIVQRVSTTDIASYLGVSRETLSRVKKDT